MIGERLAGDSLPTEAGHDSVVIRVLTPTIDFWRFVKIIRLYTKRQLTEAQRTIATKSGVNHKTDDTIRCESLTWTEKLRVSVILHT